MDAQGLNLFFAGTATVNEYIFCSWILFFFLAVSSVDGWPAKDCLSDALVCMDIYSFRRCNLMVGATISNYINQSFRIYIIDEPRYLICMGFNHYFILSFWINDSYRRTIVICEAFINVRF